MSGALVPSGGTAPAPVPAAPTPADVLALLYPFLSDADDARHVPEADRVAALALAANFRPACLAVPVQDIAQAHYAAHLLTARSALASSSSTTVTDAVPGGAVSEWQDGNVRLKFTDPGAGKSGVVTSAKIGDPFASWAALAALCPAPGDAVTGGTSPSPSARRGFALLTGW